MKTWFLMIATFLVASMPLSAEVLYFASINDVQVGGAHQLAGSFGARHTADDFAEASPENPMFMEFRFGKNSVLAHTLVDLTRDDGMVNMPIHLPLAFISDPQPEGLSIAADPQSVSIVRWVQGEASIWIRIQSSTSSWVRDGDGVLGPPTDNNRVYWVMGISARTYGESLAGMNANLPFATRNAQTGPDDHQDAVSTLFCLDLTNADLAPSGLGSELPYDTFYWDRTAETAPGVYGPGNALNISFVGDFRIGRGRDDAIFAAASAPSLPPAPCQDGLSATRNQLGLEISRNIYSQIFDGSTVTLQTPPESDYGFKDEDVFFSYGDQVSGALEVDPNTAFDLDGQTLYRKLTLTWNGGAQPLASLSLSLDATVHHGCDPVPADLFVHYAFDMVRTPSPWDEAPYDGEHQQKGCEQTTVNAAVGTWRHSASPATGLISHVTRANQGFTTQIILGNPSDEVQTYQLVPYTEDGDPLSEVTGEVEPGETVVWSSAELFNGEPVSHVRYHTAALVTAVYQADKEPVGPAHVSGVELTALRWRIYPGNPLVTWDGVALVNMGGVNSEVKVTQYNADGSLLSELEIAGALAPLAKSLVVLSEMFESVEGSYYQIIASQPLAVTSLRGDLSNSFLWENRAIPLP